MTNGPTNTNQTTKQIGKTWLYLLIIGVVVALGAFFFATNRDQSVGPVAPEETPLHNDGTSPDTEGNAETNQNVDGEDTQPTTEETK